jgi:oligoendopeptidase F
MSSETWRSWSCSLPDRPAEHLAVRCGLVLITIAASAGPVQAQNAFDPFPEGTARYHFDLARNFFASTEIEARARAALLQKLERLRALAPSSTRSAAALLQALQLQDSIQRQIGKHLAYWSLRTLSNTADTTAQRILAEFSTAAPPGYTALEAEISSTPRERVERLLRELRPLARYGFYSEQVYRAAERQPPAASSAALATLTPQMVSWGPALFQETLAAIDFGTVMAPEGPLDLRRQGGAIRSHPDRAVRAQGYQRNLQALAAHRSTFAFILTRSAQGRNALAGLRGFPDYPAESYTERFLSRDDVLTMLARVAAVSDTNRAYERLRSERVRRALGYADVHPWDLTIPVGIASPRFTIMAASAAVIAAAQPLGAA